MIRDQTLPLSGGWVLVKQAPGTQIKVPVMAIFYAMPDRVFVEGSNTIGGVWEYGAHLDPRDLMAIYRKRRGSSALNPSEIERAEKIEREYMERMGYPMTLVQRVRIIAPDGSVSLEPHEISIISDIEPYMDAIGDDEGFILHEYGATRKQAGKLEEQVFYMRSRGVSRAAALKLLIGEQKRMDMVWLEPSPAIKAMFVR